MSHYEYKGDKNAFHIGVKRRSLKEEEWRKLPEEHKAFYQETTKAVTPTKVECIPCKIKKEIKNGNNDNFSTEDRSGDTNGLANISDSNIQNDGDK